MLFSNTIKLYFQKEKKTENSYKNQLKNQSYIQHH